MNEVLWVLALIVGAGLVGSFLVVCKTRGLRTFFGCAIWLALPFAVLAFLLAIETDPSLSPERARYNFSFGLVLISLIIAVPWFLANLVGGLFGLFFRNRRTEPAAAAVPSPDPVSENGLPDWSKADNPSLSLAELGDMMQGCAELAGIDAGDLPHIGPIPGGEGVFIDRDKFDYIYIGLERGQPMFDHRTVVADELMYLVFRDRAFVVAANRLAEQRRAGNRFPDHEYAGRLAAEQEAILADIEPEWGRQFASDRKPAVGS